MTHLQRIYDAMRNIARGGLEAKINASGSHLRSVEILITPSR